MANRTNWKDVAYLLADTYAKQLNLGNDFDPMYSTTAREEVTCAIDTLKSSAEVTRHVKELQKAATED